MESEDDVGGFGKTCFQTRNRNAVFCLENENLLLMLRNCYDAGGILYKYSEAIRLEKMQANQVLQYLHLALHICT